MFCVCRAALYDPNRVIILPDVHIEQLVKVSTGTKVADGKLKAKNPTNGPVMWDKDSYFKWDAAIEKNQKAGEPETELKDIKCPMYFRGATLTKDQKTWTRGTSHLGDLEHPDRYKALHGLHLISRPSPGAK